MIKGRDFTPDRNPEWTSVFLHHFITVLLHTDGSDPVFYDTSKRNQWIKPSSVTDLGNSGGTIALGFVHMVGESRAIRGSTVGRRRLIQ